MGSFSGTHRSALGGLPVDRAACCHSATDLIGLRADEWTGEAAEYGLPPLSPIVGDLSAASDSPGVTAAIPPDVVRWGVAA